jgi:hypothetical protein
MAFFKELLRDGGDGSWSSKRIVTFLAFVFCSIAFFANLFFDRKIDANIFDGMMYIAIAGLGVTVTEKFALSRTKNSSTEDDYGYRENRRSTAKRLPEYHDKEI